VINTKELNASSRILIIATGYNSIGFLGGLNSVLNQLLYAEAFGFIPVVYFDPWSNEFPDFNRQELYSNNQWEQYFQPVSQYSYEEILECIDSPDHPLTKRNLHYLSNEEMLYLDFGNPDSIFSSKYGYYKSYEGSYEEWLKAQRSKAQALMGKYIEIKPINQDEENKVEQLPERFLQLGVIIDCFDRVVTHDTTQSSVKPYFEYIDGYICDNPRCRILLVTRNRKHIKKFRKQYGNRVEVPDAETPYNFREYNQWLALSKCDFLLKDHSEIGEFVLYLNSELPYKDFQNQLPRLSRIGRNVKFLNKEIKLFRLRWSRTIAEEGFSLKVMARLLILANPITQITIKTLERCRYSGSAILRWSVLFIDFLKLIRARSYFPLTRIKHRAFHAATHVYSGFYSFEVAPQKKYFEVRNAWDTNTGFFAYFMMALTQLKFAETHGLKPVVNFNEPHNHFFEVGHSKNIWENYFEPVNELSADDLNNFNAREITFIDHKYHDRPGNAADPPQTDELSTKVWLEAHRAMKAALTKKYIRPRSFVLDLVDNFYTQYMSEQAVLGVHIRGTDKDVDQKGRRYVHQEELVRKIGPDEYFPYVDKYLIVHPEARIFVATDQQQYLDSFKERYGDIVITNSVTRTTGDQPIFRQKMGSKFQRGVEVMCDCLLLSRCDYLIKGWSNVSEAAICFNPSIPVIDVMYLPNIEGIDFSDNQPAVPEDLLFFHERLIEEEGNEKRRKL